MANFSQDYSYILGRIVALGREVSPRGQKTYELPDVVLEFTQPQAVLMDGTNGRKLNHRIAAVETLQLVSGHSYPQLLVAASPEFRKFIDGEAFHGSYGSRIRTQLPVAVQKLKADPDTRQAVITIWDPLHDLFGETTPKDVPCTVMLDFMIRGGKLELHTTMRSNDAWLGLPYDVVQFTILQMTVAAALEVGVGSYFHHAVSLHLYERNWKDAMDLTDDGGCLVLDGVGFDSQDITERMNAARWIAEQGRAAGVAPTRMHVWLEGLVDESRARQTHA